MEPVDLGQFRSEILRAVVNPTTEGLTNNLDATILNKSARTNIVPESSQLG
jgi:hypothetical protein